MTTRRDDKFLLRLPPGRRDEIRADAKANGRSMNAEIVARLGGQERTLRDWFAGQAIAGLLACNATYSGLTHNRVALSADAYAHADAMLVERTLLAALSASGQKEE